ncbi:sugar ABC transporter permease [Bacillaceae bacterium SIJ1]|uniref:carbohydrate ABC transporter permease n=1 Tax=Litoribacterium kuwaitense TaxID=1398745 RepID=UPI0013ECA657|nr:sugar ABC transporter permease [Litoribacterium kuwaitense]NGP46206.1 sugar ABC transporter permease [Litoribacterium kuwaitense]
MAAKNKQMYLFLLPAMILFTIFVFMPFYEGIRISFTNWDGYSQSFDFIGFFNYATLLENELFVIGMKNTLIYGFACTIIQNVLGLLYALFVNKKFAGRNLVRLIIYMPAIIAGIIMGYMMYGIFQYNGGALNDIMQLFNAEKIDWFGSGNRAVLIIVIVNSLQFVGVAMMIYLAGLQNIPSSLVEAAQLDGATSRQILKNVTLPLLIPAITSSFLINIIGGLQLFGLIVALTNGGPGISTHSMATAINNMHFWSQNAGQAAAAGMVLFVMIFVISLMMNIFFNKKDVDM